MTQHYSPSQVARAIGVSESSIKRWCDQGVVHTIRTAGGHRRVPLRAIVSFVRARGYQLAAPELLGLPAAPRELASLGAVREQLFDALAAGDAARVDGIVLPLFTGGRSIAHIGDEVIAPVFRRIGEAWEHGSVHIYQERRACELTMRALHRLDALLPPPGPDARVAVGGTLALDQYGLPTALTALVLREAGWDAASVGTGVPGASLAQAVEQLAPRIAWVSVSHVFNEADFLDAYEKVHNASRNVGAALVVGGRVLDEELRKKMRYAAYCDTLAHLVSFAEAIPPAQTEATG